MKGHTAGYSDDCLPDEQSVGSPTVNNWRGQDGERQDSSVMLSLELLSESLYDSGCRAMSICTILYITNGSPIIG